MKRILETIDVRGKDHRPLFVRWQGRTYTVRRVLERWVIQGRWWSRQEKRVYFRLVLDFVR